MSGFGARLKAFRERQQLSQHELAERVGLHFSQVSRYEREENFPTAEKLAALARVLGVTADTLIHGDIAKAEPAIQNVRLLERFRVLDHLPKDAQETVLRVVDAVLAKYELEHAAERIKRTAHT